MNLADPFHKRRDQKSCCQSDMRVHIARCLDGSRSGGVAQHEESGLNNYGRAVTLNISRYPIVRLQVLANQESGRHDE